MHRQASVSQACLVWALPGDEPDVSTDLRRAIAPLDEHEEGAGPLELASRRVTRKRPSLNPPGEPATSEGEPHNNTSPDSHSPHPTGPPSAHESPTSTRAASQDHVTSTHVTHQMEMELQPRVEIQVPVPSRPRAQSRLEIMAAASQKTLFHDIGALDPDGIDEPPASLPKGTQPDGVLVDHGSPRGYHEPGDEEAASQFDVSNRHALPSSSAPERDPAAEGSGQGHTQKLPAEGEPRELASISHVGIGRFAADASGPQQGSLAHTNASDATKSEEAAVGQVRRSSEPQFWLGPTSSQVGGVGEELVRRGSVMARLLKNRNCLAPPSVKP
jgi:hypothetical protein